MREIKFDASFQPQSPLWGTAIYPGQLILITATYKAGKSVLLMSLFGNLAMGRLWGPWKPDRPVKTLYVAFEDDEDDIQASLKPFAGCPNLRVVQREWTETEKPFKIEDVTETMTALDFSPDIVILDPWLYGFNFDIKDPMRMKEAIKPIRRFARANKITVFLVHHNRKEGQDFEDDPWFSAAGSYALGAAVDSQWNLIKPKHGPRSFQITYARKRSTDLIRLLISYDKTKGIGLQYKGGTWQFPDHISPMNPPETPLSPPGGIPPNF